MKFKVCLGRRSVSSHAVTL